MLAIAGQTAGPNGLTCFEVTKALDKNNNTKKYISYRK